MAGCGAHSLQTASLSTHPTARSGGRLGHPPRDIACPVPKRATTSEKPRAEVEARRRPREALSSGKAPKSGASARAKTQWHRAGLHALQRRRPHSRCAGEEGQKGGGSGLEKGTDANLRSAHTPTRAASSGSQRSQRAGGKGRRWPTITAGCTDTAGRRPQLAPAATSHCSEGSARGERAATRHCAVALPERGRRGAQEVSATLGGRCRRQMGKQAGLEKAGGRADTLSSLVRQTPLMTVHADRCPLHLR